MTEYKKCVAAVDEVSAATKHLNDHARVDQDVAAAQSILEKFDDDIVPNLRIRIGKLLTKAREKDPDKQIYNEAMCAKIEELAADANRACDDFDAAVPYAHAAVHSMLRSRVHQKVLESALAHSSAEISRAEADARSLNKYEYGAWVRETTVIMSRAYDEAYARKKAREEREWQCEIERRRLEMDRFEGVKQEAAQSGQSLGAFTAQRFVEDCHQRGIDLRLLLRRVVGLLDELARDPSAPNVCKLRVNNSTFAEHFGHPCAMPLSADDERFEESARGARDTYDVTETVLGLVGYRPHYELAGGFVRTPPAGRWRFGFMPWERYSERFLLLKEPDPAVDTDEWMAWHERLGDIHKHLAQLINTRRA